MNPVHCNRTFWVIVPFLLGSIPPDAVAANVTVPIPSVRVMDNSCTSWQVMQTYTATPVDESVLMQLEGYPVYEVEGHFHASGTYGTGTYLHYHPMRFSSSTPTGKLAEINRAIFGTPTPSVGQTRTWREDHGGGCAASDGLRECVGVFVGYRSHAEVSEPLTFPFGVCSGVPPVGVSCSFDSGSARLDLGSGPSGVRSGSVGVGVSCTASTSYRITRIDGAGLGQGGGTMDGMSIKDMTVNDRPLPYVGQMDSVGSLVVGVTADVQGVGAQNISAILRIDIP
ncbi:hypothetical protein J2Y65_004161 [Aeromonas salmonicida]|nr:hypothetical protein [Aeromonas salmonicida]